MAEIPDIKDYVYCEKDDIFYNKKRKEEAEKKAEEIRETRSMAFYDTCPMCIQKSIISEMSFASSSSSSRSVCSSHSMERLPIPRLNLKRLDKRFISQVGTGKKKKK